MPDVVTFYGRENLTLTDLAVLCTLLGAVITMTNISWALPKCQASWQHFTFRISLNLLRGGNHNPHLTDERTEAELVTAWSMSYRKLGCESRSSWLQSTSSYLQERATTYTLTKYQHMVQGVLLFRLRSEVEWLEPGVIRGGFLEGVDDTLRVERWAGWTGLWSRESTGETELREHGEGGTWLRV